MLQEQNELLRNILELTYFLNLTIVKVSEHCEVS